MIGRLKGIVESRGVETLEIDVHGVVYELTCSLSTLESLAVGEPAVVEVYTHLREDQLSLFGFSTKLEKQLFLALLSVNGVGPKMATKILSGAAIEHIARSIESGDVKALSQLPKVGKKTAEQLIVSLKGKLGDFLLRADGRAAEPMPLKVTDARFDGGRAEIASALQNLGFRSVEIERMVQQMPEDISVEAGVRLALAQIGGR
ncbi:MAG: Holliday junction branch migration protein RuvA [Bdellovibrionaceae bacterium]|nr:Holliday junction branch migration protein RuvA [Pseudobdellovibrionaceae bacterium]